MKLTKKLFLIFIKLSITCSLIGFVYITCALKDKLSAFEVNNDEYQGAIDVIYNKNTRNFTATKENNGVQNFISCYEEPISREDFSIELNNKIDELYELFSNKNYLLSFSYEDLYTGLHISYNENQTQFGASTIKAPVVLYLYEQADSNKIDLNKKISYQSNYYVEGSGSIQYESFGREYTLRELSEKAIVESDNIAYQMIAYNLNYDEIVEFWRNKGASTFWNGGIWGSTSSLDGTIYLKELYNYYLTNTDNSKELMTYLYNSIQLLIKPPHNDLVAHKSGWRAEIAHDFALVLDEYPYVVSILTNYAYNDYFKFFAKASKIIEEMHDIYWKNKTDYCYNKSF